MRAAGRRGPIQAVRPATPGRPLPARAAGTAAALIIHEPPPGAPMRPLARHLARFTLLVAVLSLSASAARADDASTNKTITYKITNTDERKDNVVRGYAVLMVGVKPKMVDKANTKGKILTEVRVEDRFGGTLLIFETKDDKAAGIPIKGGTDDIQIKLKDLPKTMKEVKFSTVTSFRRTVGRDGIVFQQGDIEQAGLKSVNDPEYYILNGVQLDPSDPAPVPFAVRDLQYLSNVPEFADTTMLLDFTQSFGFRPLSPSSAMVDLVSSPKIDVPGPVDLNNWYYVRGIATQYGRDVPFVHGVQEFLPAAVPEPASVITAAVGGLTLAGWARRRRGQRSAGT